MSPTARNGLIALAIAAVVIGLLLGRNCRGGGDVVDAGQVVVDAGQVAELTPPPVVDAGEAVADVVVDAGVEVQDQLAIAPLPPEGGRKNGKSKNGKVGKREKPDKPDKVVIAREEPKEVDAGVVERVEPVVVDAGQPVVDAGPQKIAHAELKPEAMPSAGLSVAYRDDVSQWLKLIELRVFIDGKRVVDEASKTGIALTKERVIHETKLFPGSHQVRVEAKYTGQSSVFSYLEGYAFKMREMTVVEVNEKSGTKVVAVAYDKGAMNAWETRWGLKITTTK